MLLVVYRKGGAYYNDFQEVSITFTLRFYVNGLNIAGHYRWFGGRLCI